jgi:hypothetical protein
MIREQPLRFGPGGRLFGILAHPRSEPAGKTALLIPNTGLDHRCGPNRLHVHLSRALAEAGFPTLRMDLSGLGDSLPLPPDVEGDAVDDLRAAMDHLGSLGIARRFGGIGICSGGHDVHRLSLADPRIVASACIDHYAWPTTGFRLRYWSERLLAPRRVANPLARWIRREPDSEPASIRGEDADLFEQPSASEFSRDLDRLMIRKVALFFLFTGDMLSTYNYRSQLTDAFPRLHRYAPLAVHFLPHTDHTFTQVAMRQAFVEALCRWATRFL